MATTTTPPNEILLRLRGVFKDFGNVVDVTCSDPLIGIVNGGAIGSESYKLRVTIEVKEWHIKEIEAFTLQERWKRC